MFAYLKRRPLISICVPAYKSQNTIQETLLSATRQTIDDVEIIVSNDGGHRTIELEEFETNPKIRLFQNNRRFGWVGNSNFVLSKARGKFFMILPHDDVLDPEYAEECISVLEQNKDVFAAYSDIKTERSTLCATEIIGSIEERIIDVMRNRYNGFSYRAVMPRNSKYWPNLRLRPNLPTDFCVDTTWILQQACFGELRKVAKPLYWKRSHERSTGKTWRNLSRAELDSAWRRHCTQMGEIAAVRLDNAELVSNLVSHRLDPNLVKEAPDYLKRAML